MTKSLFSAQDFCEWSDHCSHEAKFECYAEIHAKSANEKHESECPWESIFTEQGKLFDEKYQKLKVENARLLKDEGAACDRGNRLARQCQDLVQENARLRGDLEQLRIITLDFIEMSKQKYTR